jgi:hypothetical protein
MNLDLLSHLVSIGLLVLVSCCYWRDWTRFKREKANYELKISNLKQIIEALGDYNRYVASLKLRRHANDEEAVMHYATEGGAISYAKRHDRPLAKPTWLRLRARMSGFVARFPGPRSLLTVITA